MARVNLNFVADNDTDKAITFKNFMGVDFTNTKMNVAPNRATNMKNYIYENGVNRKRPSWNEVAKGSGKVNGVWQYYDTNREEHIIAHIGTKLYRVFQRDETTSGFDINSVYTHLEELTLPIGVTLTDEISYGVTNDEKLFLLCGAYLVYDGTDIKKVTDIAYIPTTAIGISKQGSTLYENKYIPFEKPNKLSPKRKNRLFGETYEEVKQGDVLGQNTHKTIIIDTKATMTSLETNGISSPLLKVEGTYDGTYTFTYYVISTSTEEIKYRWEETGQTPYEQVLWTSSGGWTTNKILVRGTVLSVKRLSNQILFYYGVENKYKLDGVADFDDGSMKVEIDYVTYNLVDNNYVPVTKTIELNPSVVTNYFSLKDERNIEFGRAYFRADATYLVLFDPFEPPNEAKENIIVTYKNFNQENINDINKCTFGTLFNAQGGQFLFLSGNPDKPNYDWHSDYSLETAVKTMSDFTYFPETGYTAIGSHNEKNIGYTILGDGSMAIHKEATTKKDILYIRTSYLGNALGPLGEPVTDIYGNAMKEVFFTINQSAVGEGMIARNTSDNLLGDNLFLSRNGVFGLALSQNITSSERYALDRSWLINGKLTQEENLKNATAIAFDNRYYLAVNGNCYVADARFKNYISTDMPDTFSYEWWFWDNIPARLFFVINNELYFGTEQGQICKFVFDRTDLNDKTYIAVRRDSITYNDGVFTISKAYDELIEQLKDGDGIRIKELVLEGENEVEYDLQYALFENQAEVNTMDFEVPIAKINENGDFVLVNHITSDGTVVPYDIRTREGHSGFVAYFILKNKVVSFFTLPITNFGTSLFAKKITGISITPEKITNSIANILIRTRNFKEKEVDVSNAGLFNFADIDFANFTFDTDDFYTSINKKLNIKCNYAEVTFASTNDRDSILHEIVLTYKITNKNRGVR